MTPSGWVEARVEDIVTFRRGLSWKKDQERDAPGPGRIPVLRIPNVKESLDLTDLLYIEGTTLDQVERTRITKGWCVMVGSNGNPKRVGDCVPVHEPANFLFASFLIGAGPTDRQRLDDAFMYRLLRSRSVQDDIAESVQGSTGLKNINLGRLRSLRVLLPPLGEQRKIAAILSSVDDAIEATQAVIEQLQVVKKAMMAELLTRGLPGRHTRFKMTEIGEVPEEWEVVPAESACVAVIDCKNRTPPYATSGFPVIRTPNVRGGRLVYTDLRLTDEESFREWTARGAPQAGDLVITREAPVGEVCLIPSDMQACLGQRMMLMRPVPDRLDARFLLVALQGAGVQKRLELISGGSTVGHVRVGDIRSLPVPIPSLDEQKQIADGVQSVAVRIESEERVLHQSRSVKAALMSVLLTGDVRVSPDEEAA